MITQSGGCRERHEEAIPFFEAALAHQLSNAKTWFRLGVSFYKLNHIGDAESAYLRAIQVCIFLTMMWRSTFSSDEHKIPFHKTAKQADLSESSLLYCICLYSSSVWFVS